MAKIATHRADGHVIWYDSTVLPHPEPRLFDPDWLRQTAALTGQSQGRNTAWFLHHAGQDLVLRHYWRGGMVGRFNKDRYLRVAVENSRAMREFTLLRWMRDQGLPVPRAVAARYAPAGLFYRADLLMERISGTRTLADHLATEPLSASEWEHIGAVIARMHGLGVHHSDLNCRNILLDEESAVWLIDFDKCDRRPPGAWAQANLERLHRSFAKEKGKVTGLYWDEAAWQALLAGYRATQGTDA
ncbi:MAG: 3-deoxy-D-manno-octulosonic acid kinase [Rhodobacterales bacterium]